METPELTIVPKPYLKELSDRSRVWWLGWAAAALAFTCSVVVLAWSTELLYRMNRLQHDSALVQAQLDETEKGIVRQWEQQQTTVSTIIGWGRYVKDRAEISTVNGPDLPHAPPRTRMAGR